jgi:hypothetical protein
MVTLLHGSQYRKTFDQGTQVCIHLKEEQEENRPHTKEFGQKAALSVLPN